MAGKHGFSLGKSYSQRIFQNFVAEKSSAFDLPPLLLLWKKCLRHNFSDFKEILNPASLKFLSSLIIIRVVEISRQGNITPIIRKFLATL